MFKEHGKLVTLLYLVIALAVVGAFTWLGFIDKQPCDLDEQYLYCKLHPASIVQIIGVVGFYLTAVILTSSVTKLFTFWNEAHSTKWNIITFVIGVASILMLLFG